MKEQAVLEPKTGKGRQRTRRQLGNEARDRTLNKSKSPKSKKREGKEPKKRDRKNAQ